MLVVRSEPGSNDSTGRNRRMSLLVVRLAMGFEGDPQAGWLGVTAPDPRVGEIENRLNAATPGPWVEWHENGTPGQLEAYNCPPATGAFLIDYGADWDQKQKDANFIAHSPSDVAYLLGELRKRDEALARVEDLAKYLDTLAPGDHHYAKLIRAAVTGGGA